MKYYIADTHFGHRGIIKLSKRPFNSINEMDETIINNWNNTVTNDDDIYILGDFAFRGKNPYTYLKRLNGKKHLIIGNHDTKLLNNPDCIKEFVEIKDILTIEDNGKKIVLCHYPLLEWDGYYNNNLHFYGHVHNTYYNKTTKYAMSMKNAYNVGVDVIGFKPCTFDEVIEKNNKYIMKNSNVIKN